MRDLAQLTHADFEPHVSTPFTIHYNAADELEVQLASVRAHGQQSESEPAGQRRPFSLLFQSTIQQYLPQGTYRIAHAALGELHLFIVPIGPNATGMRYEAVFT